MNNEELEQELKPILQALEISIKEFPDEVEANKNELTQFILSREEKLKTRIIDFMKIDAEIAVKQERKRIIGRFVQWMRMENDVAVVYKQEWEKFIKSLEK